MRAAWWVVLAGCSQPTDASWIGSFGWSWSISNHRLTAMSVRPEGEGVEAALVGGASTTGIWFGRDTTCNDNQDCGEFPTFDTSVFAATRWDAVGEQVQLAMGTAELVVGRDGASVVVDLPLTRRAKGPVRAWIGGLTLDLSEPLDAEGQGQSCYDPRHGWLPRTLEVEVGAVAEDREAQVTVEGRFVAGVTLEEVRACLDAVVDHATMRATVDVVVAVGGSPVDVAVSQGAAWPWTDGEPSPEQPLTEIGDLTAAIGSGAAGWSRLAWAFHQDDPDARGAYVRTLAVGLDGETAYGYAQNTAPTLFLQSGFDYAFEGQVVVIPELEPTMQAFGLDELPATLDEEGTYMPTALAPGDVVVP